MSNKKKKEIDLYMEILEEQGFEFHDEYSRAGDDTNFMKYYRTGDGGESTRVYYNFKTGVVSTFILSYNHTDKFKEKIKKIIEARKRDFNVDNILTE